jgi:hypothetical protein
MPRDESGSLDALDAVAPARPARVELPLGRDWTAELARVPEGVLVRVGTSGSERPLEITIALTADGPVVRARAASLEIESQTDLVARCARFRLEADESVDIVSGGGVTIQGRRIDAVATHGSTRLKANDDVQLLGENVLLNCDRAVPPPMPTWALPSAAVPATVPAESVSGDSSVAGALDHAERGDDGAG